MEFDFLSPDRYDDWDRFVEQSPQGSVFAKSAYLKAAEADFRIGVAAKGDAIAGGIVLTKGPFGTNSNPMWVKHLGVLLRPVDALPANKASTELRIIEAIADAVGGIAGFDYNFHPDFTNWLPFYWRGFRQETRYTYRIERLGDLDAIQKNADQRVGKNGRKAERAGITIVDDISAEEFYTVHKMTYERQGAKTPYRFDKLQRFTSALKQAGMFRFLAAVDGQGTIHAVCGLAHDGNCSYLLYNGMNYDVVDQGANSLLVMDAIKRSAGFSRAFDFEGSMVRPIERFYRGFGGKLTPYFRIWRPSLTVTARRTAINAAKTILGYKR